MLRTVKTRVNCENIVTLKPSKLTSRETIYYVNILIAERTNQLLDMPSVSLTFAQIAQLTPNNGD